MHTVCGHPHRLRAHFELPVAIAINTVGTVICISVSYLIGRFSKGLTFDRDDGKYRNFDGIFPNAEGYSFTFVFFVHTLHLSTEVQGVLFGLLRTPYWAYVGGSMAALIPSMLIYTVIGDKFDFTNPLFWAFVALDALMSFSDLFMQRKTS